MYEVWIFDASQDPAPLVSVASVPPDHGRIDAERWADSVRAEYEKEGLPVRTVVRQEASY